MIPIRDENPTATTPWITLLLLVANGALWILVQGAGQPEALVASVEYFGIVPCEIMDRCTVQGLATGSIPTSMFMHGDWGHLLSNMLFLWVFGNNIEDSMGHLRFLAFYFACGLAAAGAHIVAMPGSPVPAVGASGAISGVMGAYTFLYPRVRVLTWVPPIFLLSIRAWILLGYWFILQLAMGAVQLTPEAASEGGVAVWAHVGGFVAGVVLIPFFRKSRRPPARSHERPREIIRG